MTSSLGLKSSYLILASFAIFFFLKLNEKIDYERISLHKFATIFQIENKVKLQGKKVVSWRYLERETDLTKGDLIHTEEKSFARVYYPHNDLTMEIDENTLVSIDEHQFNIETGAVFIKTKDNGASFNLTNLKLSLSPNSTALVTSDKKVINISGKLKVNDKTTIPERRFWDNSLSNLSNSKLDETLLKKIELPSNLTIKKITPLSILNLSETKQILTTQLPHALKLEWSGGSGVEPNILVANNRDFKSPLYLGELDEKKSYGFKNFGTYFIQLNDSNALYNSKISEVSILPESPMWKNLAIKQIINVTKPGLFEVQFKKDFKKMQYHYQISKNRKFTKIYKEAKTQSDKVPLLLDRTNLGTYFLRVKVATNLEVSNWSKTKQILFKRDNKIRHFKGIKNYKKEIIIEGK